MRFAARTGTTWLSGGEDSTTGNSKKVASKIVQIVALLLHFRFTQSVIIPLGLFGFQVAVVRLKALLNKYT